MGEICASVNFIEFSTLKSLVRNELFEKLVNSKKDLFEMKPSNHSFRFLFLGVFVLWEIKALFSGCFKSDRILF
jgi:hypothetical protein